MTASQADDLDAAYAEVKRAPYIFTWSGREWSLPSMSDLDFRTLMKIEQHDSLDVDQLATLFSELFSEDQRDAWATTAVPVGALSMLFERWTAHSGAKPGESLASSSSSGSTGKSSRRTSGTSTTASASRSPSTAKKAVAKKAPAKRTSRKRAPSAAELARQADAEWIAKHQALADSPPAS